MSNKYLPEISALAIIFGLWLPFFVSALESPYPLGPVTIVGPKIQVWVTKEDNDYCAGISGTFNVNTDVWNIKYYNRDFSVLTVVATTSALAASSSPQLMEWTPDPNIEYGEIDVNATEVANPGQNSCPLYNSGIRALGAYVNPAQSLLPFNYGFYYRTEPLVQQQNNDAQNYAAGLYIFIAVVALVIFIFKRTP